MMNQKNFDLRFLFAPNCEDTILLDDQDVYIQIAEILVFALSYHLDIPETIENFLLL